MVRLRADGAPAMDLRPDVLVGPHVRLEPYAPEIKDEARVALDRDPASWNLVSVSGQGAHFEAWWSSALDAAARGQAAPYVIRRLADNRVVGVSSFISIRPQHCGVEIGATFIHPDARSGPVNPAAKRLMLEHAFAAGAIRVELLTDMRNVRSQAAIAKLGATREGVLRHHKVTWTGHIRDTVIFSITDQEWPTVRSRLDARLLALAG